MRLPRQGAAIGCAAIGEANHEPLAGSASAFRRFLVLERPGAWGHSALTESGVDPAAAAALAERAERLEIRIQLIRRGLRPYRPAGLTALLCSVEPGRRFLERVRLEHFEDALSLDLDALAAGRPTGTGEVLAGEGLVAGDPAASAADGLVAGNDARPRDGLVWLVCTHGTKDPCCSQRGLPVARALTAAGETVWQSSHLGGDRYSANALILPAGIQLGRVPAAAARSIAAGVREGRLPLEHLRGLAGRPQPVQAAEIALRRAEGLDGLDDVAVLGAEPGEDGAWSVRLAPRGGAPVSVVARHVATGRLRAGSCKAEEDTDPGEWVADPLPGR